MAIVGDDVQPGPELCGLVRGGTGNATTVAKVGFFLEQHSEQFATDSGILERLQRMCRAVSTMLIETGFLRASGETVASDHAGHRSRPRVGGSNR